MDLAECICGELATIMFYLGAVRVGVPVVFSLDLPKGVRVLSSGRSLDLVSLADSAANEELSGKGRAC